jgi:hypothetical protein
MKPSASLDSVPVRSPLGNSTMEQTETKRSKPSNQILGSTLALGARKVPSYLELRRQSSYDEFRHTWKDCEPKVVGWGDGANSANRPSRSGSNDSIGLQLQSVSDNDNSSTDRSSGESPTLPVPMGVSVSPMSTPIQSARRLHLHPHPQQHPTAVARTVSVSDRSQWSSVTDISIEDSSEPRTPPSSRDKDILTNLVEWLFADPVVHRKHRNLHNYY